MPRPFVLLATLLLVAAPALAYHTGAIPVDFHTWGVEKRPDGTLAPVEVHHYGNYTAGQCWGQPVWWGLGDGRLVVVRDGAATEAPLQLAGWGAFVTDAVIAFSPWGNEPGAPWVEFDNVGLWGPNAVAGHALLPSVWGSEATLEVVTAGYASWPPPDDLPGSSVPIC